MMEDATVQTFAGKSDEMDDFRLLLAEDDSMLVGARNTVYNLSMATLESNSKIEWSPEQSQFDVCQKRQKSLLVWIE
nr:hypothetical protein BaRGS_002515 [Batillaria attramentaria]